MFKKLILGGFAISLILGGGQVSAQTQTTPPWNQVEAEDENTIPALKPQPGIWIDWRKRVIHAFGRGYSRENTEGAQQRLLALRAAKADALKRLAKLIYGMHIEPQLSIDNWSEGHQEERQKIEGLIKGATETEEPVLQADGSIEVHLILPLSQVEALTGKTIPYQ
jgi:hypothetical protein